MYQVIDATADKFLLLDALEAVAEYIHVIAPLVKILEQVPCTGQQDGLLGEHSEVMLVHAACQGITLAVTAYFGQGATKALGLKVGMTFVAGEVEADRVDNAKTKATDLLLRRNLKKVDYAAILAPDFTEAALLNVARYNLPGHQVEWLTVHK